jgi:hypothetical protein
MLSPILLPYHYHLSHSRYTLLPQLIVMFIYHLIHDCAEVLVVVVVVAVVVVVVVIYLLCYVMLTTLAASIAAIPLPPQP